MVNVKLVAGAIVIGVAGAYAIKKAMAQAYPVEFAGFRVLLIGNPLTTTRERDGATAYDFQHYPLIDVIGDISGEYTVNWGYLNYIDEAFKYSSGGIVNTFPLTLIGGMANRLELRDTREPSSDNGVYNGVPCRDTRRNESIAYGDLEGSLLGDDYHAIRSEVTMNIVSPSGAVVNVSGILKERFKFES